MIQSSKFFLNKSFVYFLFFCSLLVSLIFQENSSGGSQIDHIIMEPFIDHFKLNFYEGIKYFINQRQVQSPIFYIVIANLKNVLNNHIVSLLYLVISSTLPLIIYNLLKVKFRKTDKNYLFYLSLLIFLSPFFRSSAVWLTNDNLALVFFALSIKYFFKIRNSNSSITKNHFYCFVFLALAAYIRQYYAVFVIYYLVCLLEKKYLAKSIQILLINFLLSIPCFIYYYLFYKSHNHIFFSSNTVATNYLQNLYLVLSIFLFYLFPFFTFSIKRIFPVVDFLKKNFLELAIIFFITYFIIFYFGFTELNFGGGAIYKVIKLFNLNIPISFSFISLFVYSFLKISLDKKYINYLLILSLLIISFSFVFQKYYDPLLFIIFFTLIKSNLISEIIMKKSLNLFFVYLFFILFLFISNIYYL